MVALILGGDIVVAAIVVVKVAIVFWAANVLWTAIRFVFLFLQNK